MMLHSGREDIVSDHIARDKVWEPHFTNRMTELIGDRSAGRHNKKKKTTSKRTKKMTVVDIGTSKRTKKMTVLDIGTSKRTKKMTVLDIGANVGWFTTVALSLGHDVIAIEPFPSNSWLIRATATMPENEKLRKAGGRLVLSTNALVSGNSGEGRRDLCAVPTNLHINIGNAKMVLAPDDPGDPCPEGGTRVPVATLDNILAEISRRHPTGSGLAIDVLKIDIEGFEAEALSGARALLSSKSRRPCSILFEWNRAAQKAQISDHVLGLEEEHLLKLLSSYGFVLRDPSPPPGGEDKIINWRRQPLENDDYEFRDPHCRYGGSPTADYDILDPATTSADHKRVGLQLAKAGQLDAALLSFEAAAKSDPTSAKALGNVAVALFRLELLEDAEETLLRALKLAAPAPKKKTIKWLKKNLKEVRQAIRDRPPTPAAKAYDPNEPSFNKHHERGILMVREKNLPEALVAFQAHARHNPSFGAFDSLGVCLMQNGRLVEAEEALLKAQTLRPGHGNIEANLQALHKAMRNNGMQPKGEL
eukprot:g4316.t1